MTTTTDIILADGKPANGERFTVWPDPTGRLGLSRLWPHLYDYLSTSESFPPGWMESIGQFNDAQLIRAFDISHGVFASPYAREHWPEVLRAVRSVLCCVSPRAQLAFLRYPNNDRQALLVLDSLIRGEVDLERTSMPLPDLDETPTQTM